MRRLACVVIGVLLLAGCGKEEGGVSGSQPKEILDGVQQRLDQAGAAAEERLDEAIDKIEAEL